MHLIKDVVLLVIGGIIGAGGLKALQAKAEAEIEALKADVSAEVAKIVPGVKADASALVAKVKSLLALL